MCAEGRVGGGAISPSSEVLRRKLRSDTSGAEEQSVSPVKAARISLARAADKAFELALRVSGIRQSRLDLAEMVDQLNEEWALFPLLHDDGSVGVMCIEPACIVAFVERQTLGHVKDVQGDLRTITRTDKALAMPFLNRFLSMFDEVLEGAPTAYWTQGYRAEDAVLTRHLMVLLLDASEYRGFDMKSDIIGTNRSVSMRLYLPIKEKNLSRSEKVKAKNKNAKDDQVQGGKTMRSAALAAQVEMDVAMCKITLPLSELGALKPGHLMKLPKDAAQQAVLKDRIGKTSLPVHLGQLNGMRAVRILKNPDMQLESQNLLNGVEKTHQSYQINQLRNGRKLNRRHLKKKMWMMMGWMHC